MSRSTRWTIAVLVVVAAIITALALQLRDTGLNSRPASQDAGPTTASSGELAALRRRADLPPCPPDGSGPAPQALRGVTVQCLADGATVDTGRQVAGRTVLLNLWAYWCGPCAQELPAMAEYQRRMGDRLTVITVHQDDDAAAALSRLADWGVHLPAWQDGQRRVAAALGVPNVMPTSVILRSDGSVARILPRAFASADEIAGAVDQTIGAPG
jgi:thiol-disulfide isomerase/thioredoxin